MNVIEQKRNTPAKIVDEPDLPAAPLSETAAVLQVIERAARDPAVDIDKMERLIAMRDRLVAERARADFDAAMAEMQEELPIIEERGVIDIGRGKPQPYALWEDINEAIKPVLARHGFALSFRTADDGDRRIVTAILSHRGGHREETTMRLPLDTSGSKNNVQAVGSSTSYGKRYTAAALLNLTSRMPEDADDDGKAAGFLPISDEQRDEILALIEETGTEVAKFCGYMKTDARHDRAQVEEGEEMSVEIFDFPQGSAEWFEARRGIPTASEFKSILAKGEGKMRRSYLLRLAAERLTEEPIETYSNPYMDRGKAQEDEARELYSFLAEELPTRVGFIRNGAVGCSPDALIGDNGVLEIKTERADLLVGELLRASFPPQHKAQCQGALWVTDREWVDICVYAPKMPPLIRRATRDEKYIAELASAVTQFNEELAETVERIRNIDNPTATLRRGLERSILAAG